MSDVSELLRSLTKNERPWEIRSGRSEEMNDRERIAQVAHQKWAHEWITRFFKRIAHSLIFGQKTSNLLRKPMSKLSNSQPCYTSTVWRMFDIRKLSILSKERMGLDSEKMRYHGLAVPWVRGYYESGGTMNLGSFIVRGKFWKGPPGVHLNKS